MDEGGGEVTQDTNSNDNINNSSDNTNNNDNNNNNDNSSNMSTGQPGTLSGPSPTGNTFSSSPQSITKHWNSFVFCWVLLDMKPVNSKY